MKNDLLAIKLPPPSVDIATAMHGLNTLLNPDRSDFALEFKVTGVADGYSFVTFALPDGMTYAFVRLMENLGGFLRCVEVKAKSEKAIVKARLAKEEWDKAASPLCGVGVPSPFVTAACDYFDYSCKTGSPVHDAIKRTNAALKTGNFPWATYEVTKSVLRKSGRLRADYALNKKKLD